MKEVLREEIKQIKPSKGEEKRLTDDIAGFLKKLNSSLKDAKAILGGSGQKGTWLAGTFDVDIFVLFDYKKFKDRSAEISDILEPILKKNFGKIDRLHGSRDYFQIEYDKMTFEIVPILAIKKAEDAVNITDISPLHAKWVLKHKEYQDDVRLLKQFCKANRAYGAESHIKGFSGYICEILIVHYKGFANMMRKASKWEKGDIIDVEKHYHNKNEVLREMNSSKMQSPIVIIDPVQKTRNAAAALGDEKFEAIRDACKRFCEKPSKEFFQIKELSIEDIRSRAGKNRIVILEAQPLEGKKDIVGSKLMKTFEYMADQAEEYGFKLIDKGWDWKEGRDAIFWFVTDKNLEAEEKRAGPPIKSRQFVEDFKKKHKDTFIENGKIFALVKRDYSTLEDFMRAMCANDYTKERTKGVNIRY